VGIKLIYYLKTTLILFFLISISITSAQSLSRVIRINTSPEKATIYSKSANRLIFLGESPSKINIDFHSEKSIRKIKITLCGFQDTIVKITPFDRLVNINLKQKVMYFLSNVDNKRNKLLQDTISIFYLTQEFITNLCQEKIEIPLNYNETILLSDSIDHYNLVLSFWIERKNIPFKKMKPKMFLDQIWSSVFKNSVKNIKFSNYQLSKPLIFNISILIRNNSSRIKHTGGVRVEDKLKQKISYSSYRRVVGYREEIVTVQHIRNYLETETSSEFKTELVKENSVFELVYNFEINDNTSLSDLLENTNEAFIILKNKNLKIKVATNASVLNNSQLKKLFN